MASLRSPLVLILVVLFGAGASVEAWAGQQRSAPRLSLPVLTADASKQCCRVCRKGKPCGDGCISATKQCKKGEGCACAAESGS